LFWVIVLTIYYTYIVAIIEIFSYHIFAIIMIVTILFLPALQL